MIFLSKSEVLTVADAEIVSEAARSSDRVPAQPASPLDWFISCQCLESVPRQSGWLRPAEQVISDHLSTSKRSAWICFCHHLPPSSDQQGYHPLSASPVVVVFKSAPASLYPQTCRAQNCQGLPRFQGKLGPAAVKSVVATRGSLTREIRCSPGSSIWGCSKGISPSSCGRRTE